MEQAQVLSRSKLQNTSYAANTAAHVVEQGDSGDLLLDSYSG